MNKKTKTFLLKVFLLFILTWGTVEVLYDFNPYDKHDIETSYTATIIDKYARLQSLKSPKIVLIAGSNFAYGINSKMLEDSLQKPVVNMAMHYDYGTDFMLQQISGEMRSGDIVIMGFEYIIESEGDVKEKISMAKFFPKANEWFSYKNIFKYIGDNAQVRISSLRLTLERYLRSTEKEATIADTTSVFFRKGVNQYGDLISHFNNPSLKIMPLSILHDKISIKKPISDMNVFYQKMNKLGVKVFYVYPSYAESSYKTDKKTIKDLQNELIRDALFPILGKPEDFVFADSLCQDMVYHLNVKGRDIRTQKIIEMLKKSNQSFK